MANGTADYAIGSMKSQLEANCKDIDENRTAININREAISGNKDMINKWIGSISLVKWLAGILIPLLAGNIVINVFFS